MSWISIFVRVIASLVAVFAGVLVLPITLVSALSGGDLITLNQGIMVFAGFILIVLILLGLIWTIGRRSE